VSSVGEVVAELELLDVATLSRDEVQSAYRLTRHVRGWLDAFESRLARRLAVIAETDMSILPEADIATASNSTQSEANKTTRRAKTLGEVPQLEDALAAGAVSSEHVDAVTRASRRLKPEDRSKLTGDGDRLAEIASRSTPEQFETHLKSEIARIDSREGGERLLRQKRAIRLRSWTDKDSGMVIVRVELDPETGLRVISRIDKTVETLFHTTTPEDCPTDPEAKHDYLRAAAFTRLVLRRKAAPKQAGTDTDGAGDSADTDTADTDVSAFDDVAAPAGDPVQPDLFSDEPAAPADTDHADVSDETVTEDPGNDTGLEITDYDNWCEMLVVIDLDTLFGGLHEHSIIDNGTPHDLPIESYRRMACMAAIIPVVLNSDGVCLDLGKDVRLANRAQRRALAAMYKTCGIPGCTVSSRHCQPHHVIWVTRLGDTDLCNLIPLCSKHHHAVHEGGWNLVLHADRSLTITYPDGRVQTCGPPATYQRPRGPASRGSPKPRAA
jgi:hypothetical protein